MSLVLCSSEPLPFCCGVMDIGCFEISNAGACAIDECIDDVESSTGLFTATFIDNAPCKAAYEDLCEQKLLLYQSPLVLNPSSGNHLFLCVFKER